MYLFNGWVSNPITDYAASSICYSDDGFTSEAPAYEMFDLHSHGPLDAFIHHHRLTDCLSDCRFSCSETAAVQRGFICFSYLVMLI